MGDRCCNSGAGGADAVSIRIRQAGLDDLTIVCAHRARMFAEVDHGCCRTGKAHGPEPVDLSRGDSPGGCGVKELRPLPVGISGSSAERFSGGDEKAELEIAMREGRFFAWLAEDGEGNPVGSAGLAYYRLTPKPWNCDGRYAYVTGMFTVPDMRGQGVGRKLLLTALEHAASSGVADITLHASPEGRSLYRSVGFEDSNEMRLSIVSSGCICGCK